MEPPESTETATANDRKPPRRMPWWGWLLLGIFGVNLIGALGCLGALYLYAYLPEEYVNKANAPAWAANNVNQLTFKDSTEFTAARHRLRLLAFSREGQSNPVPRLLLAYLFEMTGKKRAAIYFYREVLTIADANWYNRISMAHLSSRAHARLALLSYQQGDLAASRAEVNALGELEDDDDAPAVLYALRDRLEEPERSDFRLALAQELKSLYLLPMARREASEALRLARTPSQRYRVLGFLRAELPIHIDTFSPMTRYYLIAGHRAAANKNRAREAAVFYEKAIGETPDLEWAYNSLAIVYRRLADYPRATQAASQAIALNPEFYQPYLTLGDIALDQERFNDAIRHFQAGKAILRQLPAEEGDGQLINLENQLAFAFERIKDYQSAFQHYSKALSMAQESDDDDYSEDYDYAREGLARVRPYQGKKN